MNPNIFREYDIRGIVGLDLTNDTVPIICRSIAAYFRQNAAVRIAIGYDARESSPIYCEMLADALTASGCDAVQIGRVPTPVLYHTVHTRGVDGGVMITGSHNPPDHNGFKICLGKDTLFGHQIQEIRKIAEIGHFPHGIGQITTLEVLPGYCRDVVREIQLGDRRLKVVVDAGNGMGGVTAVPVYRGLGAEIIELYTDPDPAFPNHHPDPTVAENLQDLIKAVMEHRADLGIAFDGDADRIGVVDDNGRILWGDELMVLFSRDVLARSPGATIIAEVKCSQNLFDDIEAHGGTPVMWQAGHSIIKAKMKESGAALAGEMSGHMFFADRYYGFDDACYAGARLLETLSQTDLPLSQLLTGLPQRFSTAELRTPCPDEIKLEVVADVAEFFAREHHVITIDGARISFECGWGLVRPSNTQAILVMRFEADTESTLTDIRQEVEMKVAEAIRLRMG